VDKDAGSWIQVRFLGDAQTGAVPATPTARVLMNRAIVSQEDPVCWRTRAEREDWEKCAAEDQLSAHISSRRLSFERLLVSPWLWL